MNKQIIISVVLIALAFAMFAMPANAETLEVQGSDGDVNATNSSSGGTYLEILSGVVELTGAQTEDVVWGAHNFAGFWHDINDDLLDETLGILAGTLSAHDKTIDEGNITYETTAIDFDFEYSDWGSYKMIGFMAEKYFAGYEEGNVSRDITNEDVHLIASDMLGKVLIDEDNDRTLSTGASLRLKEGYELKILQLDVNGDLAQLELSKNGKRVDTDFVDAGETYVYKKDLGKLDDVPIIAVHIGSVFSGTETDMVEIDGFFQISDDPTPLKPDGDYGKMEIKSTSGYTIKMENSDDITLVEDETIMLMGNIGFRVSEDGDRFYLFVRRTIYDGEPATDSDHDGVPDEWDKEPDTPAGYWTDSDGRGRMLGDMNGDGKLTSVDALMILQAAVGNPEPTPIQTPETPQGLVDRIPAENLPGTFELIAVIDENTPGSLNITKDALSMVAGNLSVGEITAVQGIYDFETKEYSVTVTAIECTDSVNAANAVENYKNRPKFEKPPSRTVARFGTVTFNEHEATEVRTSSPGDDIRYGYVWSNGNLVFIVAPGTDDKQASMELAAMTGC